MEGLDATFSGPQFLAWFGTDLFVTESLADHDSTCPDNIR